LLTAQGVLLLTMLVLDAFLLATTVVGSSLRDPLALFGLPITLVLGGCGVPVSLVLGGSRGVR